MKEKDPLREVIAQQILDMRSLAMFGMKQSEAVAKGLCLMCHKPLNMELLSDDEMDMYLAVDWCPECIKQARDEARADHVDNEVEASLTMALAHFKAKHTDEHGVYTRPVRVYVK